MDIRYSGNNELTLSGTLESSCSYCEVKEAIYNVVKKGLTGSSIIINVPDAQMISSYLIGIMLKIKNDERLRVTLRIADNELRKMMLEQSLNRYFVLESYPPEPDENQNDPMMLKF